MRDALAYLDEQKAARKGKKSPEGVNLIHKVMGILPRQKNIQQNQCAQEEEKGNLKQGGFPSQVFYDFQNIHGKPLISGLCKTDG
ncbi:MAG: hypothetical protein KJ814_01300 [Proteobacteria bacterium]|nr:hypothetical protein [Pseudomonadota bacterium]MBU2234552.1 hypothetical protein [Pseudomonadota bacterium]